MNEKWKVTFPWDYVVWVLKAGECWMCHKNIQNCFFFHVFGFKTVKKSFSRFRNGDSNLNDKIYPWWSSGIDNDLINNLVNDNTQIISENITESLHVGNSTAFHNLKKIAYISKLVASKSGTKFWNYPIIWESRYISAKII